MQTTSIDAVPKPTIPSASERIELSEAEREFLAECEAAYEANPKELHTWDEVVAYVKRKK
jgi:hypothetical protein